MQFLPRVPLCPKAGCAAPVATTLRPVRGEKTSTIHFNSTYIRTIALCFISLTLLTSPLPAEEPAASTNEPAATEPESTVAPVADAREEEKQRRAMAGLLALCGILIGGLMFVVLVMVWGARLRRLARRELPAQKTLQNELWFLKPPKGEKDRGVEN